MKVSVIIPVYNVAKYIERCLLSVLNQTWQDLEVILVNDCTPDGSMQIVKKLISSHPRGVVVRCLEHEKNKGLSAARNTDISASVGDYLYFLDSDDYISENAIEFLADAMRQKQQDFVIGNYEVTDAKRWDPPLLLGIGFFTKDKSFHYQSYLFFRNKRYASLFKMVGTSRMEADVAEYPLCASHVCRLFVF